MVSHMSRVFLAYQASPDASRLSLLPSLSPTAWQHLHPFLSSFSSEQLILRQVVRLSAFGNLLADIKSLRVERFAEFKLARRFSSWLGRGLVVAC
jgi:hypothetical protein